MRVVDRLKIDSCKFEFSIFLIRIQDKAKEKGFTHVGA